MKNLILFSHYHTFWIRLYNFSYFWQLIFIFYHILRIINHFWIVCCLLYLRIPEIICYLIQIPMVFKSTPTWNKFENSQEISDYLSDMLHISKVRLINAWATRSHLVGWSVSTSRKTGYLIRPTNNWKCKTSACLYGWHCVNLQTTQLISLKPLKPSTFSQSVENLEHINFAEKFHFHMMAFSNPFAF